MDHEGGIHFVAMNSGSRNKTADKPELLVFGGTGARALLMDCLSYKAS